MWIVKIRELINNCKKLLKFVKLPSYKNVFLKVNRTGIYFIWVRVKSRINSTSQSKFSKICWHVSSWLWLQCKIYFQKHKTIYFHNSRESKHSKHSMKVFKFQLLCQRSFQLKLFATAGKEPANSRKKPPLYL